MPLSIYITYTLSIVKEGIFSTSWTLFIKNSEKVL